MEAGAKKGMQLSIVGSFNGVLHMRIQMRGATTYERGIGHKKEVIEGLGPEDGDGKR
jgi:hypothetical protein